MEGQANYLAEWEALGDWRRGDDYLQRLLSVSGDEVTTLAGRFLDPDEAGIVVYRAGGAPAVADDAQNARSMLDGAPHAEPLEIAEPVALSPAVQTRLRIDRDAGGARVDRSSTGVPILVRRKAGALVHAAAYALGGARFRYPMRLATGAAFAGHG